MKSLPTVTIGIPAFNEAQNIGSLLEALLTQNQDAWQLDSIIVVSDGSSDSTNEAVAEIAKRHSSIILKHRSERKGISITQNEIVELSTSDYLVLIDADVLPADEHVVNNLLKPFSNPSVGIVGGKPIPIVAGPALFERVMIVSEYFKNDLSERINLFSRLLQCHGRLRAFSRELYTQLEWPSNAPEDSYSYLFCIERGFTFAYAPDAIVNFHVPQNFSDYKKQNKRFSSSPKFLKKNFSEELVETQFHIPFSAVVITSLKYLVSYPLSFSLYLGLYVALSLSPFEEKEHSLASIAKSTKRKITTEDFD